MKGVQAQNGRHHCTEHWIVAKDLGQHKTEGLPAFLGIKLDTSDAILRLREVKLQRLQGEIGSWTGKWYCTNRSLLLLIGQLQNRENLLTRMIDPSMTVKKLHHHIHLNEGFMQVKHILVGKFSAKMDWVSMMNGEVSGPGCETIISDPLDS